MRQFNVISLISFLFIVLLGGYGSPATAVAASWKPTKPIILVVPWPPGGGTDFGSRKVAAGMKKYLGVPVIIKNIPGASSDIGNTRVWRAKPDGYTLLTGQPHVMNTGVLFRNAKYDVMKMTVVAQWGSSPHILAVGKDSEFRSFEDFKRASKPVRQAATSVKSGGTIAGIALADRAGFPYVPVTGYPGCSGSKLAVVRGEADFVIYGGCINALLKSGDLVPLVTLTDKRLDEFPDTPTIVELGYGDIRFLSHAYFIVMGPPGIPEEVRTVLENAIIKSVKDAGKEWFKQRGLVADPVPGDEAKEVIAKMMGLYVKYTPLVQKYTK